MAFLVGTDEAGYGPNLGPLVVSISVFRIPDAAIDKDLYDLLNPRVSREWNAEDEQTFAIADSKLLYKPRGSLAALETGVFAALSQMGKPPTTWRSLLTCLAGDDFQQFEETIWYREFDCDVPVHATWSRIDSSAQALAQRMRSSRIEFTHLQSAVVLPERFNAKIDEHGNKASVLSSITLDLVRDVVERLPAEPIRIVCDKHGGRNNYAALLQPRFDDQLVRVLKEGRSVSTYQIGTLERRLDISFRTGGEAFLPSALASMTSKYVRELSMTAFNHFWQQHVDELRPTAGYPQDAKRFKRQIEPVQKKLAVADHTLWRCR